MKQKQPAIPNQYLLLKNTIDPLAAEKYINFEGYRQSLAMSSLQTTYVNTDQRIWHML